MTRLTIFPPIGTTACQAAAVLRAARCDTWVLITAAEADAIKGEVPPYYFDGGFACSEPITHTAGGAEELLCVVHLETGMGAGAARQMTLAEAPAAAAALHHRLSTPTTAPIAPLDGATV